MEWIEMVQTSSFDASRAEKWKTSLILDGILDGKKLEIRHHHDKNGRKTTQRHSKLNYRLSTWNVGRVKIIDYEFLSISFSFFLTFFWVVGIHFLIFFFSIPSICTHLVQDAEQLSERNRNVCENHHKSIFFSAKG